MLDKLKRGLFPFIIALSALSVSVSAAIYSISGLSKLFAEQLTKFYSQENDFKAVIIRIPGLFGGDRKSGFIYNAIEIIRSKTLVFLFFKFFPISVI